MIANMKIEFGPCPAQARHPKTREPLFYDDGSPVPLVPSQKTIRIAGVPGIVGYYHEDTGTVNIVQHLPDAIVGEIHAACGGNCKLSMVPPMVEPDEDDDEDDGE